MSFFGLILRSLRHYWRLNLAVAVGVALTAAILSGALVVGDSVKESLRRNAEARLSQVEMAVIGGERFFTERLAERVREASGARMAAAILQVEGTLSLQGGGSRENGVQVLGVDTGFWQFGLGADGDEAVPPGDGGVVLNDVVARKLGVEVGDTVILRVEIPGALSKDAPLSGESDAAEPQTLVVSGIVGAESMGRYSLRAEQVPARTIFLPLTDLQSILEKPGLANVILAAHPEDVKADDRLAQVEQAVDSEWQLADLSLHLDAIGDAGGLRQVTSDRVFFEDSLAKALKAAAGDTTPSDSVLTYLVNAIHHDGRLTPYSMATGAEGSTGSLGLDQLADDEALVSAWLAEDLGLEVGDSITIDYFVVATGRELSEESAEFTVRGIVSMDDPQLDGSWTPNFPGLLEVDNVDDWKPGIPLDKERIRDKDEDYWDDYRATPKLFIPLSTARKLWSESHRFGNTSSVRFAPQAGAALDEAAFSEALRPHIAPDQLGVAVRDLATEAEAAVAQSFDFGALFAAMSFFLIIAALILTALVFVFGVEQRRSQIGLLLAMGIRPGRVRVLFVWEAALLATDAALLGLLGGWIYTKLALHGMSGAWQAAASGIEFVYSFRWQTLLIAWLATVLLAVAVVAFASRAVTRVKPSELISGGDGVDSMRRGASLASSWSFRLGVLALLGGAVCLLLPKTPGSMAEQGMFFGAGFCFTAMGLCVASIALRRLLSGDREGLPTLGRLGRQNAVRRPGRSLAVIGLMAAGVFMVTAINSFRLDADVAAQSRASGTGGFALSAQSTLPIYESLNSDAGREKHGLQSLPGEVDVVAFRVSDGDDASCLNLNRAQQPRLMGVDPESLASREALSFAAKKESGEEGGSPWKLIAEQAEAGVIPGIIDLNTATYALGGLKVGDRIAYETSGGDSFEVELVAMLNNTLLQGSVIISESAFVEQFPDSGGYRYFLVDVDPWDQADAVRQQLNRMLEDRGMASEPAADRLNEFNAVQNTYLSIFSTLGGLGILLGTVGLAVVVGRNVLERRGQLGLMQAFGFTRDRLGRMVLAEHWFLHVAGVVIGVLAAVVAVAPKLMARSTDGGLPVALLGGVNVAILIGGLVFCWLAAKAVLRGPLMDSIRSE